MLGLCIGLARVLQLPLQRPASVVGDADLVGSVGLDPGVVLSQSSFVDLGSLVVEALESRLADSPCEVQWNVLRAQQR